MWETTTGKLEIVFNDERIIVSNGRPIEYCILNEGVHAISSEYKFLLVKNTDKIFSVFINGKTIQTFSGNYFFFLYSKNNQKYILEFLPSKSAFV